MDAEDKRKQRDSAAISRPENLPPWTNNALGHGKRYRHHSLGISDLILGEIFALLEFDLKIHQKTVAKGFGADVSVSFPVVIFQNVLHLEPRVPIKEPI